MNLAGAGATFNLSGASAADDRRVEWRGQYERGSGRERATLSGTASGTFGGVIGGTGSVTFAGTGTQTLTGANTHTGGTTINGGSTLALSAGGSPHRAVR